MDAKKEAKKAKRAAAAAAAAAAGGDTAAVAAAEEPPPKRARRVEPPPAPAPAAAPPPHGNGRAHHSQAGPAGGAGADESESCEVFVKFLPRDADEAEVAALFAPCGALAKPVSLLRDFASGAPKGAGWVTFASPSSAHAALKLNGAPLRGRHLEVTLATHRKERPGLKGQLQVAGTHTPALLAEVLSSLVAPFPDGVFVDATFGRGGHSAAILGALSPAGRLHGLDMDAQAVFAGAALASSDSRFCMHSTRFGDMRSALPKALRGTVAGVLFDLGLSSPQLDDPQRGMRPEADGPLDLRFDVTRGEPAWRLLEELSREELAQLLSRLGDGQDGATAVRVADAVAIAKASAAGVPRTTSAFGALVSACRPGGGDYQPMHAAKLSVQALRMAVNGERAQLRRGLAAAFKLLRPGGRLGIITWKHSEAALVTSFLRDKELAPRSFPLRAFWEADASRPPLAVSPGLRRLPAVRPGAAELRDNARARSAVLHVLVKEEGVTVATAQAAAYEALGWEPLPVVELHAIE